MRVRELVIRYAPLSPPVEVPRKLATPRQLAAEVFIPVLGNECTEVFLIACLSTKHQLLCLHEVSRGSLDSTVVHPREVFKAALLANAAAVVLAHNHPSGDASPSPEDVALTARLVSAGDIIGIDVLDHIIVGTGSYFSFKEAGQL